MAESPIELSYVTEILVTRSRYPKKLMKTCVKTSPIFLYCHYEMGIRPEMTRKRRRRSILLEWSIVIAAGAWVIVSLLLIAVLIQTIRFMRQTARILNNLEDQANLLMKQTSDLTERADRVLCRAQEATDEIIKWREASEQTRSVVQGWCESLSQFSRKTQATVESFHSNHEQRIRDTLQWVDIGYTVWQDVRTRCKRDQG